MRRPSASVVQAEPPRRPGRRRWLATLAGASLAAVGVATATAAATPGLPRSAAPVQVVASFSILADLTREIGGSTVQVTTLAGANADPHAYQPSPSDVQRLARADLLLVNGLGFEGWLDRLVANAAPRGRVVVASDGIAVRQLGPLADPHAWQSPAQVLRYVDNIEAAVLQALAERGAPATRAAEVRSRAADYRARLQRLDREIREALSPVPEASRRAITAHGAFGYFGRDYGITFTGLHGFTPDAEASAGQLARMIRQVRAQRAVALFAENTSDPRLLQRVAEEAGVTIGGTLYADALSGPGGPADTYLRLATHNARTITEALRRGASASPLPTTAQEPAR